MTADRLEALRAELARWDAALEPTPDNVTPIHPDRTTDDKENRP